MLSRNWVFWVILSYFLEPYAFTQDHHFSTKTVNVGLSLETIKEDKELSKSFAFVGYIRKF